MCSFNVTLNFQEKLQMAPIGIRLFQHIREQSSNGRRGFIDPFVNRYITSSHGVPLGGVGAGSIGRSYKGEFQLWQLFPRICEDKPVLSNQFSVFVSRTSGEKYSSVLFPASPHLVKENAVSGIGSWDWNLKSNKSTYHALYPRAWTVYEGTYIIKCYIILERRLQMSRCFSLRLNIDTQPPLTFAIAARESEGVQILECSCFFISGDLPGITAKQMWQEIKQLKSKGELNPIKGRKK